MIKKRYQYWSREGIKWTNWFEPFGNLTLDQYRKMKPAFKKLKEEYVECD